MAKKKPPLPPEPQTPAPSGSRLKNIIGLRGTDEWKTWLDGLAKHKGMPVTVLIDHALRELAKRDGYPDPPVRVM